VKDKWMYIILLMVALAMFLAGYVCRMTQEIRPIIYRPTIQTELEFKRLALKHGQRNTRVLRQEWTYINGNGKKCILK